MPLLHLPEARFAVVRVLKVEPFGMSDDADLHLLDLQIASVALEHSAPLVTHNRKHFGRVPGLVIEDWLE